MATLRNLKRIFHIWTLGFRGTHSSRVQKYMCCQLVFFFLFLFLWIKFSGGLLPSFLTSDIDHGIQPDVSLTEFFSDTHNDAALVTWARRKNDRIALSTAISSSTMMIEGDILLKGQGTDHQELIPIMAHAPQVTADLTFKQWIQMVKGSGKGIKLDFKSIEPVDLCLQTLNEERDSLHFPIWLNADILPGPGGSEDDIIDDTRFMRLTSTMFPKSTISIGWSTGPVRAANPYYDWMMIVAMHDVIESHEIEQPLSFAVRAMYARYSLRPLLWLCEMTGASLTVYSHESDVVSLDDLTYIRSYLSHKRVFYDLPKTLNEQFMERISNFKSVQSENTAFSRDFWNVIRNSNGESVYMGTEAVVMQNSLLVSKAYRYADYDIPIYRGHVTFLPYPDIGSDEEDNLLVFDIFLHVTQSSNPSIISGVRCTVSSTGRMQIATQSIPGVDKEDSDAMSHVAECFAFEVRDDPLKKCITYKLLVMNSCQLDVPDIVEERSIMMDTTEMVIDGLEVGLRATGDNGFIAVNHFSVTPQ